MKAVVVCALVAIGCGGKSEPSADDLRKELGPKIEPKLVVAEKIAKEPLPAPTGTIKLSGPPGAWVTYNAPGPARGNATIAFDADLKDFRKREYVPLRYDHLSILSACWTIVRDNTMPATEPGRPGMRDDMMATQRLPACAALRYLVVVKIEEYNDTKYVDAEHFVGGNVRANALVFDLDTGAYLGGVPAEARSSRFVKDRDPEGDLRTAFYKALESAIDIR